MTNFDLRKKRHQHNRISEDPHRWKHVFTQGNKPDSKGNNNNNNNNNKPTLWTTNVMSLLQLRKSRYIQVDMYYQFHDKKLCQKKQENKQAKFPLEGADPSLSNDKIRFTPTATLTQPHLWGIPPMKARLHTSNAPDRRDNDKNKRTLWNINPSLL